MSTTNKIPGCDHTYIRGDGDADTWQVQVYHEGDMHEPAHVHTSARAVDAVRDVSLYASRAYATTTLHVVVPHCATDEEIVAIREALANAALLQTAPAGTTVEIDGIDYAVPVDERGEPIARFALPDGRTVRITAWAETFPPQVAAWEIGPALANASRGVK